MTALYLDYYNIITIGINLSNNNEKCLKAGLKSRLPKFVFLFILYKNIYSNCF